MLLPGFSIALLLHGVTTYFNNNFKAKGEVTLQTLILADSFYLKDKQHNFLNIPTTNI